MSELTPLLHELREGGLAANVETLSRSAASAATDLAKLQSAVLTDDNVQARYHRRPLHLLTLATLRCLKAPARH